MPSFSAARLIQPIGAVVAQQLRFRPGSSGMVSLAVPRPGQAKTALRARVVRHKAWDCSVRQVCGAGEAFR